MEPFNEDRLGSLLFRIETGIAVDATTENSGTILTGQPFADINDNDCELLECWLETNPEPDSDHADSSTKRLEVRRQKRLIHNVKLLVAWYKRRHNDWGLLFNARTRQLQNIDSEIKNNAVNRQTINRLRNIAFQLPDNFAFCASDNRKL
jgi:hypothetical protein